MALSMEHIKDVCKIGQGQDCCRYLVCGPNGFECHKVGSLKGAIDSRALYMTAKGSNCKGVKTHDD